MSRCHPSAEPPARRRRGQPRSGVEGPGGNEMRAAASRAGGGGGNGGGRAAARLRGGAVDNGVGVDRDVQRVIEAHRDTLDHHAREPPEHDVHLHLGEARERSRRPFASRRAVLGAAALVACAEVPPLQQQSTVLVPLLPPRRRRLCARLQQAGHVRLDRLGGPSVAAPDGAVVSVCAEEQRTVGERPCAREQQ